MTTNNTSFSHYTPLFQCLPEELKTLYSNKAHQLRTCPEELISRVVELFTSLTLGEKEQASSTLESERVELQKTEKTASPTKASEIHPNLTDLKTLSKEEALKKVHDCMHSGKPASDEEILNMYHFFSSDAAQFDALLKMGSDPQIQFDAFLFIIQSDLKQNRALLNDYERFKDKIFDFSFTNDRFEWIQINNDQIDSELHQRLLVYENQHRVFDLNEKINKKGKEWHALSMQGSTTLTSDSEAQKRWVKASEMKSRLAVTQISLEIGHIQKMHRILTSGESGINNPGNPRKDIIRISGRGSTALPPPPNCVESLMVDFENWMTKQKLLCAEEKKSVILTSAQAYQRLVTIHPFENGNGRVSRLIMNYILEYFKLPSAILEGAGPDAIVFALHPKKPSDVVKAFVMEIFEGVKKGYEKLNDY